MENTDRVSIPFIAGQWSLRVRGASGRMTTSSRFNPLHCGAVVASGEGAQRCVSARWFQSPSLRGSGRFPSSLSAFTTTFTRFQSPSLRGSGRFIAD